MYTHPHHQIAKDRVAGLHLQAQHDALARAARHSRRPAEHHARQRVPQFLLITGRRALTALGAYT